MNFTWIPFTLAKILRTLGKKLSRPQFRNFRLILLGIMLGHGRTDLTALAEIHRQRANTRTNLGKFLNRKEWNPQDVLRTTSEILLATALRRNPACRQIELIIDSTLMERASLKVRGAQIAKGPSGVFVKGQIAVVAIIRVGDLVIPFALELQLNKHWAKVLGQPHRTQHQITIDMINAFPVPANVRVVVLFDSFFASRKVLVTCQERGFTFVTNLKANRLVRRHRPLGQVGGWARNVLSHSQSAVTVGNQTFLTAHRSSFLPGVGRVFLTFSRKPGHHRVFHLVTNAFLSAQEMVAAYLKRWSIECFFKDVKHHLGWGRYPARRQQGATAHLHLILMAHALLTHLRFEEGDDRQAMKKRASSIAEVRSDLRTRQQAHQFLRTARRFRKAANFDQIWNSLRLVS